MMEVTLTLDDLRACDWAPVIASAAQKECVTYCETFRARAEQARADGKEKDRQVFQLLSEVCSFGFEPQQIVDPFPPRITLGNARWPVPSDIAENDLAVLSDLLTEIQDPELRARIADLLWVKRRNHHHARLAIDA